MLAWVARGRTNSEIGSILSISSRTIQKHLEHIFQKLGVESRTAAASRFWEASHKRTQPSSEADPPLLCHRAWNAPPL